MNLAWVHQEHVDLYGYFYIMFPEHHWNDIAESAQLPFRKEDLVSEVHGPT